MKGLDKILSMSRLSSSTSAPQSAYSTKHHPTPTCIHKRFNSYSLKKRKDSNSKGTKKRKKNKMERGHWRRGGEGDNTSATHHVMGVEYEGKKSQRIWIYALLPSRGRFLR